MDEERIIQIAHDLMEKHNLLNNGWVFKFDNAKQRVGLCRNSKKIISVSKYFITILDEEKTNEIILHEIAHAIVGSKHGHDNIWKQKAIEIGSNGNRLYDWKTTVKPKYKGTCPTCNTIITNHRRSNGSCSKCCNVFNKKHLLIWSLNE